MISPLNSIIEEQISRYGDRAIHLSDSVLKQLNSTNSEQSTASDPLNRFRRCEFTYVIGHPEQFVTKTAFKIFKEDQWQCCVSHIIIDECHCVIEWGPGFREKYLELSKLKALFPKAHILALTATATVSLQKEISKVLELTKPCIISTNIDRTNIKLEVNKRPPVSGGSRTAVDSYDFIFTALIAELREKLESFPETIIYSKLKWCGYGFEEVTRPLVDEEYDSTFLHQFVAQYHSPCTP